MAYKTRDSGPEKVHFARRLSYLIDPSGVVVRSYTVSDIPAHASQVLADLAAVKAERGGA